jgi:hypothetical protein
MLLKEALDREFYVGNRLYRIEPVFAAFTKALFLLSEEVQRACFEHLVAAGKVTKRTLPDESTEYSLRPPLIEVVPTAVTFDDGIDPMQWITRD